MADTAALFLSESRRYLTDDYVPRIRRSVERLTDAQVWWRPNEASNSIGNLLLHLSGNVRQWIVSGVGGATDSRVRQQEFDERAQLPSAELLQRLCETIEEADRVLAGLEPAELARVRRIQGRDTGTFEAIYHVVEHFSTHTGQIEYIAKQLAGAAGSGA